MSKETKKKSKTKEPLLKPRKIRIRVVGIGGGGSSIVSDIARGLKNVSFLLADTDSRVFKKAKRGVKVFQFGEKLLGGMGTGMNSEIAFKAANGEIEKIEKIFKGQDLSILVGSLGGGVCSGAGPIFAQGARNQRNITLGIFTLPFSFEGEKKMRIAYQALQKIKESLSGTIVVPNEKIFQIIDRKTPLKKALSLLNQIFANWLGDLIEIISKPNLINIDFADLRTILKEQGEMLFLGQGIGQGQNRVEEVIKSISQGPIFGEIPKNAKRILFNITGGKDLKLKEVESVSESISRFNSKAKIIFGISENSNCKGKIKVTLLAVSDEEKGKNYKRKKVSLKKNTKSSLELKKSKIKKVISGKKEKTGGRKKGIRRSALEVKRAEEEEEKKEMTPETDWAIPSFLRNKLK